MALPCALYVDVKHIPIMPNYCTLRGGLAQIVFPTTQATQAA